MNDALIEAVAKAIYEAGGWNLPAKPWSLLSSSARADYTNEARAAIAAIQKTHFITQHPNVMVAP